MTINKLIKEYNIFVLEKDRITQPKTSHNSESMPLKRRTLLNKGLNNVKIIN